MAFVLATGSGPPCLATSQASTDHYLKPLSLAALLPRLHFVCHCEPYRPRTTQELSIPQEIIHGRTCNIAQQSLIGLSTISGLVWEWGGIDEEFILCHVVRVAERDHPVAKGLAVTSLNGRSLTLTDTTVTTAKGFKLLRQARLVSEKIFYDNEGRGWIVQFIDRPLVGLMQESQDPGSPPGSPNSNRGDITRPVNSPSIDQVQAAERQEGARASRRNRQRGITAVPWSLSKLGEAHHGFNDGVMTKGGLDEIQSSVDRLLTDSVDLLNQVDAKVLSALLDEYRVTVDILDQLLEIYIMNSTYDIVFFKISSHLKQQDWELAETIRELRDYYSKPNK
ncbi:MAG: hypothetical protein J3R72DRAFT_497062 [Linnemannia gamsii]|nr:MAG: hypothetical protein J3R72DRAFT_497062 [Linnemannia gamsii]